MHVFLRYQLADPDVGVVIGFAAGGIVVAVDQGVGFGPVHLQRSGMDCRYADASAYGAEWRFQQDIFTGREAKPAGVVITNENFVAACSSERVVIPEDDLVELGATAGRESERSRIEIR